MVEATPISCALTLRRGLLLLLTTVAMQLPGCANVSHPHSAFEALPAHTAQAVVVTVAPGQPLRACVAAFEQSDDGWRAALPTMRAVVGLRGIVPGDRKREGDGGTPSGMHRVGLAFGYEAQLATGLEYRQATAADWWIDDPLSPSYNRWVTSKPQVSAEAMRRDDDQYEVGCVLEWNTQAPVPGRGSAIFFHVWKNPETPTSGCVAVSETDARALLAWLDRSRSPVFVVCEPRDE